MMKFMYPIVLLLGNLIYAQNGKADTLNNFTYSQLKNKFYESYENEDVFKTKLIAQCYLNKAKKEKNNLQIAEGYILAHFNENFSSALQYIDSLAIISKNINGSLYPTRTYLMRGNLYFKHDYLKKALDNYIIALQYAKDRKDQKQFAYANINIAYLNNYLGKYTEAAKTFRYYLYNSNDITNDSQHNQILVSLIYCYIELGKLDSANILIKEGQTSLFTRKSKYSVSQYSYFAGYSYLKQKKYKSAITELLKAYDFFSSIHDHNANYALYSLGKSYIGLKDNNKAVQYFIKLDSNVQKTNKTFPQLREVYTYLIDYYKEKNDKEKQLYYIDRFLKIDKKLDEQFEYLSAELPKKYDTPNLLQEKESIINDLKKRKKILYVSISILTIILLLVLFLYFKAKKTAKEHRKIAQELIQNIEKRNFESNTDKKEIPELPQVPENVKTENAVIKTVPEEITVSILKDLEIFENKQLFLKSGITLPNLAKNMKTNTAYLSEVINTHKGKNFTSYLNDLRIDYVLERLVKDKKFRSYKLPAIAEEIGYNNVQAFAVAFKKKTGTTPSIYIKEIEVQK